jgi:hypothetical protein
VRWLKRIGTVVVVLVMLGGGALVAWNVFGQGPYNDSCSHALGCRSFYCLEHELVGSNQWTSTGYCTKKCEADSDCGSAARCVVLSSDALDDLPPYGKPDRACMRVR